MLTLLEIIKRSSDFLATKGVESPRLNAEMLIGHALGLRRMELYLQFERTLQEAELERIRPLIRRRSLREPVQYIIGEMEFGGLRLKVDRRSLIPRPETEYLLDLLMDRSAATCRAILDLGTGSGAIALALAHRIPEARVTAVERSAEALALARENGGATGLANRVSFLISDWFSALPGETPFDLIVANPPYLSAAETEQTEPEVKDHEPRSALCAGREGLADLQAILSAAPRFLSAGGMLALETGIAQHDTLRANAAAAGFTRTESVKDLTGRERYFFAWKD